MKHTKLSLLTIIALLFASCAVIQPGNDPVLVNAERTTAAAYTTFDSFLALERSQDALVKVTAPEVHKFANNLRANGKNWLQTARAETEAYRSHRTAANKADLNTIIAILQTALSQITVYSAQLK